MNIKYIDSNFDRKRFHVYQSGLRHLGMCVAAFDLFCDALFYSLILESIPEVDGVHIIDMLKRREVDFDAYWYENDELMEGDWEIEDGEDWVFNTCTLKNCDLPL